MKNHASLRMVLTLAATFLISGCGTGAPGQPGGLPPIPGLPGAPTTGLPGAPTTTSTTSIAGLGTSTSTTSVTVSPDGSVTLDGSDSSGTSSATDAQKIGAGLLTTPTAPTGAAFKAAGWQRAREQYGSRVNFWEIDTAADPEQAKFLGWKGVDPTVVITRGKDVIDMVEGANEAALLAKLATLAPATN